MTTIISPTGADFANYVDQELDFLSTCTGFYLFGENEALSVVNHGSGADATMVEDTPGDITFARGYAEFPGGILGNYFDTGLFTSGAQSYIWVGMPPRQDPGSGIEYLMGQNEGGFSTHRIDSTSPNGLKVSGYGGANTTQDVKSGAMFSFVGTTHTGNASEPFKMYVGVNGSIVSPGTVVANNGGSPIGSSGPVQIGPWKAGGAGTGAQVGGHKVAAAAVFTSELTSGNMTSFYNLVRLLMAKRKVQVV